MSGPYRRSAELYDAIYSFKPYAEEADAVRRRVEAERPGARTLLDVGCGTGVHLAELARAYEVAGVDLSEDMLAVARQRLPGVPLVQADQRAFDLGRTFDAVVCLFSAIGYVRSVEELDAAVASMARHVGDGGVLLIEPWFTPEQWHPGRVNGSLVVDEPELKIARFVVSSTRDRFAVTPMHHLVATPAGVEHFVETHELFLANRAEVERAFVAAGLRDVRYDPDALVRGLWIGRR
jgi:SAM-dependent methyltransferase